MLTKFFKNFPWHDLALVGLLILIDFAIHPLTPGPDRLIHDPAVYRLWDSNYLAGDWYTGMSIASGVYTFYAHVVNAWHHLGLTEELWRTFLYLTSLGLLYYALIRIARVFTQNWLVVPIVVLLHAALVAGTAQPIWLYGPFIQIDGGLAPRSIGVALSFMGLFFLLKNRPWLMAMVLGLATLVHVSNSLIIFSLFFLAWLVQLTWANRQQLRSRWLGVVKAALLTGLVYIAAGGWFALYVAGQGSHLPADFSTEKFIWTWVDLRAPYMHLPLISIKSYLRLFAHVAAIGVGWWWLKSRVGESRRAALALLALIGFGAVGYFFLFYLFAFIYPWLPGFQFYSLRIVYLTYFVAYVFIALGIIYALKDWLNRPRATAVGLIVILALTTVFGSVPGIRSVGGKLERLQTSQRYLGQVLAGEPLPLRDTATLRYLYANQQPFLAPPSYDTDYAYLPNVASYKSFGFTQAGLVEWYERVNEVSRGEIERSYQAQQVAGDFRPLTYDWMGQYNLLTPAEIEALGAKYGFDLIIVDRDRTLPFTQVAEDEDNRLYRFAPSR